MAERLTRDRVVRRAAELADEIGLDAVTITKLGRALGIAPPGVYRHVADLAALHRGIGTLAADELAASLSQACAGLSGADALAALAATLRRWAVEHPGRYAALQVAPEPDDAEGQAAAGRLLAVIGSALRAYRLAGDDQTDAIRLIRSALHGFVSLELGGGFRQPRDPDATFDRMVGSLDTMLRSWTP
ncbi:MAG: WHG domain-containing protein [Micropruina sp.]|uniref:TetR/AcrR family transcriptional regulator n=1 Tax=Micropruina sp. TaxID=2737536 RepID=UPI0039E5F85F